MTRSGRMMSVIWAVSILLAISSVSRARDDEMQSYDCGFIALYTLLRLENRPIDLETLEACLPPPRPGGYSMKELRDAARKMGLHLTGVKWNDPERSLDRPALVFLQHNPHGHFSVIRPVGHTGKLVQVLDGNDLPSVVESAHFFNSEEWTGVALIPGRPNWPIRIAWSLLIVGIVTVLTRIVLASRIRRVGISTS